MFKCFCNLLDQVNPMTESLPTDYTRINRVTSLPPIQTNQTPPSSWKHPFSQFRVSVLKTSCLGQMPLFQGADMAGLAEVPEALTWAPPAGPSSKQIFSEGHSDNFGPHLLAYAQTPNEPMAPMYPPNQNATQRFSQVLADCSMNRRNQTGPDHGPPMDVFMRDCYCSRFLEMAKEVPRSSAPPRPDCGTTNQGNSEQHWLVQVDQVARRLTIPLWQNWDRGQKLPLLASADPVFDPSQSRQTAARTELPSSRAPFGVNTAGLTLDRDGGTSGPESCTNLKMHGLDQVEESSRTDTGVLQGHFTTAADNLGWISAGQECSRSLENFPGNKGGHTSHPGHTFKEEGSYVHSSTHLKSPFCPGWKSSANTGAGFDLVGAFGFILSNPQMQLKSDEIFY